MVYEARPGQTFLLGRVDLADRGDRPRPRDRHARAGRCPGPCRSGRATASGARASSARRSARSRAGPSTRPPRRSQRDYDLDAARGRATWSTSSREQQAATGVIPSDRAIVIERFRDEIGDWRLCVLSPFGGRVHAAWGLALSARGSASARPRVGRDLVRRRDHRPPPRRREPPPAPSWCCSSPTSSRSSSSRELGGLGAVRRALPRERGPRAADPARRPGRRTPLWQQRLKAQTLLEVARKYADFPIILETYRECLRDVLDLPGAARAAGAAAAARDLAGRGRDADRLAVRLLAAVRLRRDLHVRGRHAERRAPRGRALARPRSAARAARPGGAARADRPGRARRSVEADLQRRSPSAAGRRRATSCTTCCATLGDLTAERARGARARRAGRRGDARRAARRAARRRGARRRRGALIAAEDAGLYRDALGVDAPGGLPEAFLEDVPDALRELRQRATPRPTGRSRARRGSARATASTWRRAARARARRRCWSAASCAPATGGRRARMVRSGRAAAAAPRLAGGAAAEIEPAERARAGRFLPSWQGVDRHAAAGRGGRAPARGARPAAGTRAAAPSSGSARSCRGALGAYSTSWLDQLCAAGEIVWVGAGAIGVARPRRALLPRRRSRDRAAGRGGEARGAGRRRARADPRAAARAAPASSATCCSRDRRARRGAAGGALGPRLGGRGHQRRVGAAARPAARAGAPGARGARAGAGASRRRRAPRARASRAPVQGRWSLAAPLLRAGRRPGRRAGARSPSCCSSATAS